VCFRHLVTSKVVADERLFSAYAEVGLFLAAEAEVPPYRANERGEYAVAHLRDFIAGPGPRGEKRFGASSTALPRRASRRGRKKSPKEESARAS
jgi:hypothetical protein